LASQRESFESTDSRSSEVSWIFLPETPSQFRFAKRGSRPRGLFKVLEKSFSLRDSFRVLLWHPHLSRVIFKIPVVSISHDAEVRQKTRKTAHSFSVYFPYGEALAALSI